MVDLGIFFSNLLDLSNLRVLSLSMSNGAGGRTNDLFPSNLSPFRHVDLAIWSFLACAWMETVGAFLTALATLFRNLGLSFFEK